MLLFCISTCSSFKSFALSHRWYPSFNLLETVYFKILFLWFYKLYFLPRNPFLLSLVSFFHIQALTLVWQFFCVGDSCSFPTDFAYSLVSPSRTVKTYHVVRMGSHCGKLTATTSHPPPCFYGLSHFLIHRTFLSLILSAAVHISTSLLFPWTGL